jgi:hypothetical protein
MEGYRVKFTSLFTDVKATNIAHMKALLGSYLEVWDMKYDYL